MPRRRPYRLGKRQASVNETKRRILDAAFTEYNENGIEETTMVAVARRANVAPGTVLYHYPEPEALAEAVADRLIEEVDWPEVHQIAEDTALEERVDLLLDTVYAMYETARPAADVYRKSPEHPAVRKLQSVWDSQMSRTIAYALGSHVIDEDKPMISAILEGPFLSSLLRRGVHEDQIQESASRLIVAWLKSAN